MAKHILIVEDSKLSRATLIALLESDGFVTGVATDGQDALHQLRQGPRPDLILLDMILPIHDGWYLLADLRKDPTLIGIPVVIMTGLGVASEEWARSLGAAGLLRKPIDVARLLETVRRFAALP